MSSWALEGDSMHEYAGRLRRRRMLLLFRHQPPAETPTLVATSDAAVSADEEYVGVCGREPRYALCVEDQSRRVLRHQPFDSPVFLIGQGPGNDLWLKHDRVQSRHLLLVRLPEGVYFQTLSPQAKVFGPNGSIVSGWWTQGMVLRVGAFRLKLTGAKLLAPLLDPLAVSPALEGDLPRLELRFLGAATPQNASPVTRTLTLIGRSPVCKIRLDHESILPVEAVLIRTAGRLWLINLGDSERVLVNDAPTLSTMLDVGDQVGIGDFRMEVQSAEEWPQPAAASRTATSPSSTANRLDELVQECAQQHEKILAAQQQALANLELLAAQTANPGQLRTLLEQIRKSSEALGSEQARLQEKLQRNLNAQDDPHSEEPLKAKSKK